MALLAMVATMGMIAYDGAAMIWMVGYGVVGSG